MIYDEAGDALNLMFWPSFKDEAKTILGYMPTVYWPLQVEPEKAPVDKFWMRVTRRTNPKTLAGFGEGNADYAARYDESGTLYLQLFYPQCDKAASTKFPKLAEFLQACFLGKNDPTNILWCRDVAIKELDSEKAWFRINVVVDFKYQDIKGH